MPIALNPEGGKAVVVGTKVADSEVTRLVRLAALAGVRKSVILRQALAAGLDQLEQQQDTPPPEGG